MTPQDSTSAATVRLYGNDRPTAEVRSALRGGEVPIGVYGLGKMGLPLAAVYADVTGNVRGADVDPDVVEAVNRGESHVVGEPGLPDLVGRLADDGALRAQVDPAAVADAVAVHVVIVPTLVDESNEPDLSVVKSVARDIASGLDPGDMVIFESTLPPRACADELLPLLERESGLSLGEFGLAFCPERTKSGRAIQDIRGTHPKIVGGADEESTRVAELVYGEITSNKVIPVSDTTTAESVKVFEGVYRDVNIALANELGRHAREFGIDVTEAIDAANTQPVCDIHTPGAGVGGHCIPYYPHFIIQRFEEGAPLLRTARDVNESMPPYAAEEAIDGLREEGVDPASSSVLVLGLTYRPGVEETRATPALPVIERLADEGVNVVAVDPVLSDYAEFEAAGARITSVPALEAGEERVDGAVLVTPQPAFDGLDLPSLGSAPGDGDGGGGNSGETSDGIDGADGPGSDDRRLVVVDGRQALTELRSHPAVHYRGIGLDD